jgi:hypothetical protein
MKRQQSYAGVSIAIAAFGAVAVGGVIVLMLAQDHPPSQEALPKRPIAAMPAKVEPPAKTKEQLAREASDRLAAELQAKLAAMPEPKEPAADSIPGNAVPRAQFREAVIGKTAQDVAKLYGRPDSSMESTFTTWTYRRRTYDPNTGKPDLSAIIHFSRYENAVESVSFY